MKAIVKTKPDVGLELLDVPMPEVKPDELLVKVLATGICGSDQEIYKWAPSKQFIKPGTIIGHEFFGEVVDMGNEVHGFSVGDRISSDSHLPCGKCYLCRTGKPHLCMKSGILGNHVNGCFAEYLALPQAAAIKMDPATNPVYGALMEPMGVVYHAAMRTPLSGRRVLVIGAGALGYMMVHAAKTLGASRVMVSSTNDDKIKMLLEEGADFAVNSRKTDPVKEIMEYTHGVGADVIFEMSGAVPMMKMAYDCAAYQGTIVNVGIPSGPVTIEDYWNTCMTKELTMTSSFGRLFYETWELMADLLETGKLRPEKYVCGTLPLEQFEEGFAKARGAMGRVVFTL